MQFHLTVTSVGGMLGVCVMMIIECFGKPQMIQMTFSYYFSLIALSNTCSGCLHGLKFLIVTLVDGMLGEP